jgi:formate/nitrite transporter
MERRQPKQIDLMNYVKPSEVVSSMIAVGAAKGRLPIRDMLVRGAFSGALLGISTTLAINGALQSIPLVGALIFPVGFVIIVLCGFELVTGNFALLPVAAIGKKLSTTQVFSSWAWVFLGNLIGSLLYAFLFWAAQSMVGHNNGGAIGEKIVALAEAKTTGYSTAGWAGMGGAFFRAILCNWMVCFGVVMAMVSTSVTGKILAMWLPVFTFFAQGFEHAVVNMFLIPCGMLFGAKVTLADWWLSNQLIVTVGNLVGGALFTGLALYFTHANRSVADPVVIAMDDAESLID